MNDPILFWNAVTLEVQRRDFTVNGAGDSFAAGTFTAEQGGPTRVSRCFAMVHIAMHQAYKQANPAAGLPAYAPLGPLPPAPAVAPALVAMLAAGAVAGAARTVLKVLWPKQSDYIEQRLPLAPGMFSDPNFTSGLDYGHTVGVAIVNLRQERAPGGLYVDGSQKPDDMTFSGQIGRHRPDPFTPKQGRLSTNWGSVTPFAIPTAAVGTPIHTGYLAAFPPLGAPRYQAAVLDVKDIGEKVSTTRPPNETLAGIFWGYDGPKGLGVPPRLYNQMVRAFVEQHGATNTPAENASLFTSINVGMADAAIVAWSAKYDYDLWRPVVGIREHDAGFGMGNGVHPSGVPTSTYCDPTWAPLGRPGTNNPGDMTKTPDFPSYPSGHATFGAVAFRLTALFFANKLGIPSKKAMNDLSFSFVSDEFNAVNQDPSGDIRVYHNRTFSLREAIIENALSRVFLGVHWRFDGLGAVAPKDLEGPIPKDPADKVKLSPSVEQELGGVPIGLKIAKIVAGKF